MVKLLNGYRIVRFLKYRLRLRIKDEESDD
jgi:hypothetical protein